MKLSPKNPKPFTKPDKSMDRICPFKPQVPTVNQPKSDLKYISGQSDWLCPWLHNNPRHRSTEIQKQRKRKYRNAEFQKQKNTETEIHARPGWMSFTLNDCVPDCAITWDTEIQKQRNVKIHKYRSREIWKYINTEIHIATNCVLDCILKHSAILTVI